MKPFPYFLVIISSFLHAYWNFLLKRASGTQLFIGLSKGAEILLFALPFYLVTRGQFHHLLAHWHLFTIGALLSLAYYVFLGRSYKAGDLSVVYPVSRAGALVFLPLLAYCVMKERVSVAGVVALGLIIVGCFLIQLRAFDRQEWAGLVKSLCCQSTMFAVLAAFAVACYSLWDKHSVLQLAPFLYFYSYTVIMGICYALMIFAREKAPDIVREWRTNWLSILLVGAFNTIAYLMVLFSLQEGKATYVIALRQLSIAVGAFLGWRFLKEKAGRPKQVGILTIIAGCLLVSIAK